ncbi:unnamed protein product [Heterotrigona itama]|uniref:Uncharacterized protein n=1 Tax=Heterotrigona itama TaxID=395501 RepID=A0A6V7HB81_9HYME|nr:unnamed protein product [Heterotrigona itama]
MADGDFEFYEKTRAREDLFTPMVASNVRRRPTPPQPLSVTCQRNLRVPQHASHGRFVSQMPRTENSDKGDYSSSTARCGSSIPEK